MKKAKKKSPKKTSKKITKKIQTPKDVLLKLKSEMNKELLKSDIPRSVLNELISQCHTGRPAKYDSSYCKKIIDMASEGIGVEQACIRLGIVHETSRNWMKKYPNFLAAIKRAKKLCEEWWVNTARKNLYNKEFNNVLWMMNMSNRFGWKHANAQLQVDKNINKKSEHREIIQIESDDHDLAKLGAILVTAGAIQESRSNQDIEAKVDEVHSSSSHN